MTSRITPSLAAVLVSLIVPVACARAEAPAPRRPDTSPGVSLETRWMSALERISSERGDGVVWVGWSVRRPEEALLMSDTGPSWVGGDGGRPLYERLGLDLDRARRGVAFLFALPIGEPREEAVVATRLRSLWSPVDLGDAELAWLGQAADAESVALLERIFSRVRSRDVQTEYGPMVAVHADAGAAVPVLRRILTGDLPEAVRAETVAWIGYQLPEPEAARLVVEVLRARPSYAILDEAVTALDPDGGDRYGLLDVLIGLLVDHPDPEARALVAEALGEFDDPRALEALESAALRDPVPAVRMEAVDVIADSGVRGASDALARIAVAAADPGVRREAADRLREE